MSFLAKPWLRQIPPAQLHPPPPPTPPPPPPPPNMMPNAPPQKQPLRDGPFDFWSGGGAIMKTFIL